MGDSIEEGSIASILKKTGDQVSEDETFIQIETDKVTIDVRAPSRGTLEHVLVTEEETVRVGQILAMLGDPSPHGMEIPVEQPKSQQIPQVSSSSVSGGYVPSIRFPPRVTPEGVRVSDLPKDQAVAFIKKWQQSLSSSPVDVKPQVTQQQQQQSQAKRDQKVVFEKEHPSRRTLTEREMEMIELGGALP